MQYFTLRHVDGTTVKIKATNEAMARQFAMEKKYGPASANRTWNCNVWYGSGLSLTEESEDALG